MMMNFKKNQNNAVCSMDCKNCPHGASQPNPMDDSMFEKSIAMLHNWLMLEAIREDHPKERMQRRSSILRKSPITMPLSLQKQRRVMTFPRFPVENKRFLLCWRCG